MLVWLLKLIFNIAIWVVDIASWLVVVYFLMTLLLPKNKYTLLVGKYVDIVKAPIAAWLTKTMPKLSCGRVDLSIVAMWVCLYAGRWLLVLLRNILL